MLGIKKQQAPHSVIGADMQVGGPCRFRHGLRVDGEVQGDVTAEAGASPSWLIVGESGSVHGSVQADHVIIAGKVVGTVHARERLEMLANARVQGDVHYKALDMQPGATIAGQLHPQLTPPLAATPENEPALAAEEPPASEETQPASDEPLLEAEDEVLEEPTLDDETLPPQDKNQVF